MTSPLNHIITLGTHSAGDLYSDQSVDPSVQDHLFRAIIFSILSPIWHILHLHIASLD